MNAFLLSAMTMIFVTVANARPTQVEQTVEPTKVKASFTRIYAPGGFDSNDHVQILGEGVFKNSCFKQADTQVRIDEQSRKIYVTSMAYEYSGMCLQVMLPYQQIVNVGILKPGSWEIVSESNSVKIGQISIREASSVSADDFLYAPVSQAFFYQTSGVNQVLLTGEFSNSCLSIDDIKVTIEPQVIVLQPIAHMDSLADCKEGKFPFSKSVEVGAVPSGKYLLHVRSLNGNAINSLIRVE